jgi:hypothetical protein
MAFDETEMQFHGTYSKIEAQTKTETPGAINTERLLTYSLDLTKERLMRILSHIPIVYPIPLTSKYCTPEAEVPL